MNCYLITYDLKGGSSSDYSELYKQIKSYGTWAKITESCWAVLSDKKSSEVRDHIKGYLKSGDRLFVAQSSGIASWSNVICKSEWLKENL